MNLLGGDPSIESGAWPEVELRVKREESLKELSSRTVPSTPIREARSSPKSSRR
jgi:hypothetical protein